MTTRLLIGTLALFACAPLWGCASQKASAPAAATAPASSDDDVVPPGAPTVELQNPGAEPRQLLRYQVNAEQTRRLVFDMDMIMKMGIGATTAPEQKVTTKMVASLKVAPLTAGQFRMSTTFEDVQLTNDAPAALKQQMATLKGLVVEQTFTARGMVMSSSAKPPEGLSPAMAQMLDGMKDQFAKMMVPFPREPVGPGAAWTVKNTMKSQGVQMDTTTAMKLVERAGHRAKLDATVGISAPPQNVEMPNLPPGSTMKVESMQGEGRGSTQFDLTTATPTGTVQSSVKSVMTMSQGQAAGTRMTMDMKQTMSFAPQ